MTTLTNNDSGGSTDAAPPWSPADRGAPIRASTWPDLFEETVARHPDTIAVIAGDRSWNYVELDRRANRLARELIGRGAGPERSIVVAVPRSLGWLTAVLAVLKTGACYVPLDTAQPPDRLRVLLDGIHPTLSVTTEAAVGLFPGEVLVLDEDGTSEVDHVLDTAPTDADRLRPLLPKHPAYVIHTSGSTGVPKGVQVTHTGLVALRATSAGGQRIVRGSRVLQGVSPHFDVSMGDLAIALLTGATLVLPDCAGQPTGMELTRLLVDFAITHLVTTPGVLGTVAPEEIPGRLTLAVGGEVFPRELLASWSKYHRVLMAYGPTETTVLVTLSGEEHGAVEPSMGRPGEDVRVHVLDGALREVPEGAPGELYVAGPSLARGYLGRPAATAERFVANPFGPPGDRLYRTGDVVRRLADGNLRFVGRADDQIKIRGNRIEPAEIEAVLEGHPRVSRATVVAYPGSATDTRLCAYVVAPAETDVPPAAELREFLRTRLPEPMVPSVVVALAEMPLNRNGKVDRAALPAPVVDRTMEYVPPRNDRQKRLCRIWSRVLGGVLVGIDDDFFDLGGHSLLATRALTRVRDAFGVNVPIREFFDRPTVRRFAEWIEDLDPENVPSISAGSGSPGRLSFAQRRLWFLDQLVPDPSVYNVQTLWRIDGPLDRVALEWAIGEVWRRHDVLRGRCENVDGAPTLVSLDPSTPLAVPVADLSSLAESDAEASVHEAARQDAERPFDLATGPLMRARLFVTGVETGYLMVGFHHIVVDGWSMNVLWQEISDLYDGFVTKRATTLPPLPVQYAHYAEWQHRWLEGAAAAGQLDYWRGQLDGIPEFLDLAGDHPRPRMLTGRGGGVDFTIPVPVAEELRGLGHTHGATLFMVLLTAFDVLLSRHTGGNDIVTGSPVSGRVRPELDGLVGFFVNTLALRVRWSGDPDFLDLLKTTRDVALDAYTHEAIPFEHVVAELTGDRDPSRNPIFQIWFDVDSLPEPTLPNGLTGEVVRTAARNARFDLEMVIKERNGLLTGRLGYSTDLFTRATAERMVGHFLRLLAGIAEDPLRPLSRLPMLDEREHDALLTGWNRVRPAAPRAGDDLVAAFAAQAARTPDRVALVGGEALTYAELHARAHRLARYLRARGVGPEQVVGVCMNRGVEVFVVMLGVLVAGGVYLPLDPTLPADRLAYLIQSSGARMVLGHSALRSRLSACGTPSIEIDGVLRDAAEQAGRAAPAVVRGTRPTNLSYLVYTSGSTGRPKGIAACDATVGNLVDWTLAQRAGPRRCAQLSSIGFDVSFQEFFETLCAGGTLVVVDDERRADPDLLLDLLSLEAIERLHCSPALFHQLAVAWGERSAPPALALAEIMVGGEPLRLTPEIRALLAAIDGVVLENQYGPSETHEVTRNRLTGDPRDWPAEPSIGAPISGVGVYVLDRFLRVVPVGVRGEVYVTSPGLARGYHDRPELTAARFVADPFALVPGSRMYRTGDVARWSGDGALRFLGRSDEQVKIRGYRIEPGEVEVVVTAHPRVLNAVVIARPGAGGISRLVAYVEPTSMAEVPSASELREFVRTRLPDYMVPAAFVPIEGLPLNRNGKIDREALPPVPDLDRFGSGAVYAVPRSPHEVAIANIWAEILQVEEIGAEDNFFDLGGHSLLATQVMSRVRRFFAVALPVRALFENPTVARLAGVVEAAVVSEITGLSSGEVTGVPHG